MNIEEISDYIFIEDTDYTGDIALVFGTWDVWQDSIDKAAQIYNQDYVQKVIVSSGPNPRTGVLEGDLMAKDLEKLGVPLVDILVENKSTNTLENVLLSKSIIDKEMGFENIRTIVAVVKNFHARRSLMTLKKNIPNGIELKLATYTSAKYPFTKNNWYDKTESKEKVLEELEKIKVYLAKGDIEEL